MTIIKIIIHFFKTWFLPMPAHDEIEQAQAQALASTTPDPSSSPGTPPNFPGESPPIQDNPPPFEPEPDNDDAEALARPEPPLPDPSTTDFSHMVKPPEGSDSRVDRKSFMDDSSDDTTAENRPAPSE